MIRIKRGPYTLEYQKGMPSANIRDEREGNAIVGGLQRSEVEGKSTTMIQEAFNAWIDRTNKGKDKEMNKHWYFR